ncbi:MAG: hypothetical protein K9G76_04930 [Bacteroidales bacterium]|nr:hypothetical protein [Bacteroidales bacterium]MCF8403023.1 hypothetical protein [Bacteroidales bacterium]
MKKARLLIVLVTIIPFLGFGADSTFLKPKGTVYGKIFTNFHSQINTGDNADAFEIQRAYFGYKSQLSKYFEANIKLDIGSPNDVSEFSKIRRYAYFKNAYVGYKKGKISSYFGIIDLLQFKVQEKYWGHRYIEKSFDDRYKFGSSADLAWQINYDHSKWISVDFTVMNGEGYTQLQTDNTLTTGFGVSLYPVKNFTTRFYYDVSEKTTIQSTLVGFLGYKLKNKIMAGLEYNYRFNDNFVKDKNRFGYSAYVSYYPIKKFQVFGRYDKLSSNKFERQEQPWNLAKDGSSIIAGVEFSPIDYVKIALNYQDWFPYAANEENSQYIYLNFEISF